MYMIHVSTGFHLGGGGAFATPPLANLFPNMHTTITQPVCRPPLDEFSKLNPVYMYMYDNQILTYMYIYTMKCNVNTCPNGHHVHVHVHEQMYTHICTCRI